MEYLYTTFVGWLWHDRNIHLILLGILDCLYHYGFYTLSSNIMSQFSKFILTYVFNLGFISYTEEVGKRIKRTWS